MADTAATQPTSVKKPRTSILRSLLLLLTIVGLVPLMGTSYTLVSRAWNLLDDHIRETQLDKVKSFAQQVTIYMRSLDTQVATLAETLAIGSSAGRFATQIDRIAENNALERYLAGETPLSYVALVGVSGQGPRSGVQLLEPEIQEALRVGWERGMAGEPARSEPLISTSLQEPVVVLAAPIKTAGTSVEGVVLAVASLGPLWSMAEDLSQGGQVDVYLVDTGGRLVAHSNPARLQGNRDWSSVEIVRTFMQSQGRTGAAVPFILETDTGPVEMLGTVRGVPGDLGWGVIAQQGRDKAYFEAIQMRNNSWLLVGSVTILALLMGTAYAGRISQPIRQLASGARRLAEGEYGTRVKIRSSNEVGVLSDAFNHMGAEIEKSIEEIREAAETNKKLFMGSVRMLANAIDEKDPYTRGHSERVAYYSKMLAKHLGLLTEAEVENVYLSGLLHDVGKIGVEDKILRKPAALTDAEYELMKEHPTKGLHILEAVPMLKEMAGGGLMHHENWDGSGYPDGLKEEEIPLLGRIVSVADAFDAMTTDRPYSKGMTFEAALDRLKVLKNKKFDGVCVDAMDKAFEAGDISAAKARLASIKSRQQQEVAS